MPESFVNPPPISFSEKPLDQAYRAVFESMDQGVFIINNSLAIIYLNPKAVALTQSTYGITYKVGDHVVESLPKNRHAFLYSLFNRVLAGETIAYDVEVPQEGSSSQWLHCADTPLYNDRQQVFGFSVLLSDITAQKGLEAAEAKQRELEKLSYQSRLLFEEFMQNAPLIGWITDDIGTIHYMNPAFLSLHGFMPADLGRSIYELFSAQGAVDFHLNDLKVLKDGQPQETIEKVELPEGNMQVQKVHRFPIKHQGVTMVAAWAVDITEQTILEGQLKRSLERYYYVNEATTDAIYDWKIGEERIYRGNSFDTLFGYIDQVVSLRDHFRNIHASDRKRIRGIYLDAVQDPLAMGWALEYRFRCADGKYKYVLDKATIVREKAQAVRVLGALQDTTEQKLLQAKLVRQEKEKKHEIVRSIIEAQEKERRKLSIELHDNVNQMLASCKLLLEVACDGGANALELTKRSFKGVSSIIKEIRKISHDLNPSALEDVGLIDAITEMTGVINAAGKMQINFRHVGLNKLALKNEDSIAIYRIIQEQVNNILKHSYATTASIELARDGAEIRLHLKDNGVGFDVKKAKKGLGIRNIQNRVDYYSGTLDLRSTKGAGSSLEIRLRLDGEL